MPTSKFNWIRRRARRLMAAYDDLRRWQAVREAASDWANWHGGAHWGGGSR